MKCYYHPDIDSVRMCTVCSRSLCASCAHTVRGSVFCQDCLVAGAELAAVANRSQIARHSPQRAAFLALMPGIGAVYNKQYAKAVQHFAVFAALAYIADQVEIFLLAAMTWLVFTIIDAYRSAQEIVRQGIANPEAAPNNQNGKSVPLWGGILIVMGVLFFLNNLFPRIFDFRDIFGTVWPLLFVVAGLYLIYDYYLRSDRKDERPPARVDVRPIRPPRSPDAGAMDYEPPSADTREESQ